MLYSFLVIGEWLNRLGWRDAELARRIADIDDVVAMRNVLIHGYDETDFEIVWQAIKEELPALVSVNESLLSERDRPHLP